MDCLRPGRLTRPQTKRSDDVSTVIKPEPSRHVHFIPATDVSGDGVCTAGQPHAGIIAHVWGDRLVNLLVVDKNGWPVPKISVPLVQPGDAEPTGYDYCRWMPYTLATEAKRQQQEETAKHSQAMAAL